MSVNSINHTLYPNVTLGENSKIDKGVIVGFKENGKDEGTILGKNAILRANTIIYAGVKIGENFQSGPNVLIREDNTLGNDVVVWHGATINPGNKIGDGCRIHAGSFLEHVTLGKRVFIGPRVVFTDDPHPVNPPSRIHMQGAQIEDEVVIGANTTILPYVKIGKRAIIGAGSVVTKDVPEGEVWVGNPARFLKRTEDIECNFGEKKHYPYKESWGS